MARFRNLRVGNFPQKMNSLTEIIHLNDSAEQKAHSARVDKLHTEATNLLCKSTDMNTILGRVIHALETSGDESDIEFAEAAIRVAKKARSK